MLDAVIKEADSRNEDFNKTFTALMESSIAGIESKRDEILKNFALICQALVDIAKNKAGEMYSVGNDFVSGFAQGIRENAYRALDEARNMATKALEATKSALKSHSPSKETENLGNYFGEGFILGIRNYFSKVYGMSYELGESAKDGLNNAIAKISSIISSDINTQPRITPILDLDNIRNDIQNLNSLLNSESINGNVNAINNIRLSNQNAQSDRMLSALDGLTNTLNMSNTRPINIYTQELDTEKLKQILNYVNSELGKVYE